MTKPTSPMTDAQRRVLERMAKGEKVAFHYGQVAAGTRGAWFVDDHNYSTKYIHMATFDALEERGWIEFAGFLSEKVTAEFRKITEEGLKALNYKPGE